MTTVVPFSDFEDFLASDPQNSEGCFVDTNVIFAADYELHNFHEEAASICGLLYRKSVPIYANSIIRSELLNLKRRVLVSEGLVNAVKVGRTSIPTPLRNKLSSLETTVGENLKQENHYFIGDHGTRGIKNFRDLFEEHIGTDAWRDFCDIYLKDKLHRDWALQLQNKKVRYVGTDSDILEEKVNWGDMVDIMEKSAIGSSDAMIINFFLNSKLNFLVSADKDVVYSMKGIDTSKIVICPDSFL